MKLIKEKKIFHYALAFIIVTISYMIWRLVAPESKAGTVSYTHLRAHET